MTDRGASKRCLLTKVRCVDSVHDRFEGCASMRVPCVGFQIYQTLWQRALQRRGSARPGDASATRLARANWTRNAPRHTTKRWKNAINRVKLCIGGTAAPKIPGAHNNNAPSRCNGGYVARLASLCEARCYILSARASVNTRATRSTHGAAPLQLMCWGRHRGRASSWMPLAAVITI